MRKKSPLYRLTLGVLLGAMFMPTQIAQAQFFGFPTLTHDPITHGTVLEQKIENAVHYVKIFDNAVKQYSTLKGVLGKAEELVTNEFISKQTMADIGRTVRASFELKDQIQAITTTRLTMLRSMDDRFRRGIFDPEADMRDLEDYLRTSIGRSSEDSIANFDRLCKIDPILERLVSEWRKAQRDRALTQKYRATFIDKKEAELRKKTEAQSKDAMSIILGTINFCDGQIADYTRQIETLWSRIEERVKKYHALTDERIKFAAQVGESNKAWSDFNDTLDGIQRALDR
jgi:hypothetical protein